MWRNIANFFMDSDQITYCTTALHNLFQRIVETYFVVQIIHFTLLDISTVFIWLVNFSQQEGVWRLLFYAAV